MKTEKLLSFHNDTKIKEEYLKRLQLHHDADEIIKGTYWQNGKGCGVGCTVHSSSHKAFETELGISQILARLEDRIFESLPNERAKPFPIEFLSAIPVGVDLSSVWRKLMIWILTDADNGVIKYAKTEASKKAIQYVSDAFNDSLTKVVEREKWLELRRAAADAYAAAYADAAYAAAYAAAAADAAAYAAAAADAYAADAAAYAAAAADAAAYAAYAAAYAADAYAAAADAADADADAYAAYAAARQKYYVVMVDKLISLFKEME